MCVSVCVCVCVAGGGGLVLNAPVLNTPVPDHCLSLPRRKITGEKCRSRDCQFADDTRFGREFI